jgi:hypothetical protein
MRVGKAADLAVLRVPLAEAWRTPEPVRAVITAGAVHPLAELDSGHM